MPKLNFGFDADAKEKKIEKKKGRGEPDPKIEVRLNRGQILMFADKTPQSQSMQEPAVKYIGKFLYRTGYTLTVGVYIKTDQKFEDEENDIVLITYMDQKALFSFNARIIGIKEASATESYHDRFEIDQLKTGENQVLFGYDKYIFEVVPISVPEKQQRREFFRMNLAIDIYYKATKPEETEEDSLSLDSLTYHELQYELDHAKEGDDGYVKLRTVDLSAGGFRAKSKVAIEANTVLECMLAVGFEVLPAMVKILSSKQEDKNDIKNGVYDVRAIFYDMSDQIRDRIVRYIFAQQRQIQARHNKK